MTLNLPALARRAIESVAADWLVLRAEEIPGEDKFYVIYERPSGLRCRIDVLIPDLPDDQLQDAVLQKLITEFKSACDTIA